jgi:hypothetical protein
MVVQAAGLAFIAAVEASEVLRAAGEVALGGGAQYIRDGQPVGVAANLGLELARVACRRYGNDPSSYPSDTALNYEKACRPYLEDIGEGSGPGLALPFRGGQCFGAVYAFDFTFTNNQGSRQTLAQQSSGKLVGTYAVDVDGQDSWNFGFERQDSPGGIVVRISQGTTFGRGNPNPVISNVVRIDGGNDDCGNTEPEVRQPTGPTIVLPPIVPIIIAPDIDVDARVEVNIDGTIDIDLGTGDITIDPFGDDDDSGSGGDSGADDSPPNPEPGPELPGGNGGFGGDDGFGEPPAGRRWVGCCITITSRPVNQPPIPNTTPEDVYASVVGNIRLVYDASGTRQTDTPVRIQARKVCVWEAVRKLNPVGVRVDLQAGFGYTYRPYSVPLDA